MICKTFKYYVYIISFLFENQAGCYPPESSVEHPEAVENLAEEFARAGADITQTFTFYSRDVGTPDDCTLTVG